MAIPVSLLVCLGMALATIGYAIRYTIYLFRAEKTFDIALNETPERLRQLCALVPKLQELKGKEREIACRQAARLVREDCRTLLYLINNFCLSGPPKDEEIRRLSIAASTQVRDVYLMTHWIFLLLYFRPSLLKDCRRVRETMWRHGQAWLACFRLLRAQYPAKWGNLDVPD